MATSDFTTRILKAFADAMEPLTDAVSSQDKFGALLAELGWLLDSNASMGSIQNALRQPVSAIATLVIDISTGKEISQLGTDITNVVTALVALENVSFGSLPQPLNQASFWQTFPRDILELLIYRYIKRDHLLIFGGLSFIGVLRLDPQQPDLASGRQAFNRMTVDWNQLPKAVAAPSDLFKNVYGWGGDFDHTTFVENLTYLLQGSGVAAQIYPGNEAFLDIYYDPSNPTRKQVTQLVASPFQLTSEGAIPTAFIKPLLFVMPVPPKADATLPPEGMVLFPYITGGIAGTLNLEPGVDLTLEGGFDVDLIRVVVRPSLTEVELPAPTLDLNAKALLHAKRSAPWIIAGDTDSTRLELWEAHVALFLQGPIGKFEFKVEAAADDARLILDFSESDGFLQTVLGSDPQTLNLSPGIVLSNRTGFALQGQAALEASIPVHQSMAGLVAVETIYISLLASAAAGSVTLVVAASGALTLGPVEASVDRVGLAIDLKPRDLSNPGNLGALDLSFAFKPPNGLGIAIDSSAVTGGGFIEFDDAKGRYAGVLELSIDDIGVKAIGLLDTKLPGGAPGYSFIIIITADFPPITLGFGFTLTGAGGLAGINRTMVIDAIQAGLRNHSVDHILFPEDPVRDASQIISDLSTIFPPAEGRYVLGPMARIAWSTPPIVEAELGILIELPDPVHMVLLGQIYAALPNTEEDDPIVELHLDIVGVVDFNKKTVAIDGVLHDSKISAFDLSGDIALRLNWGDQPAFVFSVGGLNPSFQPPPGFPTLRRVTFALSNSNNPRLTMKAYLAITSNTVQFGALADLYYETAGFNVSGTLGFDVLVVVSPLSFIAHLGATVAVKRGSDLLASVSLKATLTGPTPWHVWGEATFDCVIEITVSFDATIGEAKRAELPAADPGPDLKKALEDARNWSATLPPSTFRVVSLAQPSVPQTGGPFFDPLGGATVRERVVPLNRTITRFAETRPLGPGRYTITSVSVGDQAAAIPATVQDYFAPAQFEEMGDAEKLSRPSFEKMDAGFTLADDAVTVGTAIGTDVVFNTIIVRPPGTPPSQPTPYPVSSEHQLAALGRSASALAPLTSTGSAKFAPPLNAAPPVTLDDEGYVIASVDTLDVEPTLGNAASKGAAYQALAAYVAEHPSRKGRLQVVPAHEVTV